MQVERHHAPGNCRAILKIDGFWQDAVIPARQAAGPFVCAYGLPPCNGEREYRDGLAQVVARKAERMPDSDYVEHQSNLTFVETVDHLVETIE